MHHEAGRFFHVPVLGRLITRLVYITFNPYANLPNKLSDLHSPQMKEMSQTISVEEDHTTSKSELRIFRLSFPVLGLMFM